MKKLSLRVNPLEWRKMYDGRFSDGIRPNSFSAENYRVHLITSGWVLDDGRFTFLRKSFASEKDAKEAAQSHWESRLKSAVSICEEESQ